MKKAIPLLCVFLLIAKIICAQTNKSEDIRLRVLHFNNIGKAYRFSTEDSTLTYLRFLGSVHTVGGKSYKILTSIWIWGLSHRATSRILVYTSNNGYVGNYYLTTTGDVPDYIKNNKLVFLNKGHDCDARLITYLDFDNGIPKQFFRKCKDSSGDIYAFSTD
ncbi:hypothetical protein HDF18_10195 [Mucilaginibacter sp. X5P1]|uniref:hypothetical protein n=1 Tax=Mucilaginibacter sp. X5P1 TaxID=2723088 RepID=UPI001615ABF2|nr:hypothetical protein [Mucilaginibacter sp. X5P1]MBB6140813.1 hypothetical protein [Mucilaginibacter sp. X5P1]